MTLKINKPIDQMTKEELYSQLNLKQKRFADNYLITLNATDSAEKAGYSKKTAKQQGTRLLSHVIIAKYIELSSEEMHADAIMSREEVLQRLTNMARRKEKDNIVVTIQKEKSEYIPDETGKPRKHTVKEEVPEVVEIPTKNMDTNKALELLGKHYKLFTDKTEITGAVPVVLCGDDEIPE